MVQGYRQVRRNVPRHLQLIELAADGPVDSCDKKPSKENVFKSGEINTGVFMMFDDRSAFLDTMVSESEVAHEPFVILASQAERLSDSRML